MPLMKTFKQIIIIKQKNLKKLLDLIVFSNIVKYQSGSITCINSNCLSIFLSRTLVMALLLVEYSL